MKLKEKYDKYNEECPDEPYPELIYLKDDFLNNTSWALEGDVIFANATCFEDHMVKSVSKALCENLKPNSVVILTTKQLEYSEG